jgi:DNA repair protein RecN (Recombination protein N)
MLKKVFIQNYAIISSLEVEFTDGLVIITGETGAGKSILMGALGLALGERADASTVRIKDQKTIVEAVFHVDSIDKLKLLLNDDEIEWDSEMILRREIQPSGKSRAFVNDTPVSMNVLAKVASVLVDLHQQFDTLELGNRVFQQMMLDAKAGAIQDLNRYKNVYQQYTTVYKRINTLKQEIQRATQEKEYKAFLLNELEQLDWMKGEQAELEAELNTLSHADQIRLEVSRAESILSEGERPMVPQLKQLIGQLQTVHHFHPLIESLISRLQSLHIEMKDIGSELNGLLHSIVVDERRMEMLNERIALAQRLSKKHGLFELDALADLKANLELEQIGFDQAEQELEAAEGERVKLEKEALALAQLLHVKRKKEIPLLEKSVRELLTRVGMPNAVLKVELKAVELSEAGTDEISFLFDANKSGRFEPLHKVASGGELSRLMLILKSLVAGSMDMPTLIFDEIDSGISGEAAKQVGLLMKELSATHQLIAITHQPQIAAKANQHLYVYKKEDQGTIVASIKSLDHNERIQVVAKMLAGENPSDAVLASAREMMKMD